MAMILAGGGEPVQSLAVDATYREMILHKRVKGRSDIQFLAHAVAPDDWTFDQATKWLLDRDAFRDLSVDVPQNLPSTKNERDASSVFLMGGNTFRLMDAILSSGSIEYLSCYAERGILYGCSAGAIILGYDISTAFIGAERDENPVGISDMRGLDLCHGFSVLTHYNPADAEDVMGMVESSHRGCICIPENGACLIEGGRYTSIGVGGFSLALPGAAFLAIPVGAHLNIECL